MTRLLLPKGYLMDFNLPPVANCEIARTSFIGRQRRLWRPLDAVAIWRPGER